jgi:F-type H+-transporting ATPase subunit delta
MARQRAVTALALGAGLLGLVGRGPLFVGPNAAAVRSVVPRTQMNAVQDRSGLMPGGPLVAYTDALSEAAAQKGESVPVTKDIMKLKALYNNREFLDELGLVVNDPSFSLVEKAEEMLKLMQPLESTVVPKFVVFLAKRKRLQALKPVTQEYMETLYETQKIVPVRVTSATALTEEQKESIKAKMKAKTGATDIKLMCTVDDSLLAGLTISFNYVDQEKMEVPTEGIDFSMKSYLNAAALNEGVVGAI